MSANGYVYAGVTRWREGTLSGVFRKPVGEGRWEAVNTGFPELIHVQTVVVHPADRATLFAGTSDGPYRSVDRGESWQKLDFPEASLQIWSIHIDPTDHNVVYAGASPVEVFKSEDGGDTWRRIEGSRIPPRFDTGKFVNRVMRIGSDYHNPDVVYGASEVNGFIRSLDRGETWEDANAPLIKMVEAEPRLRSAILTTNDLEGMFDIHALCVTPAAPDTVFTATRMGLFRSRDRGETWDDLRVSRFSPYSYGRDVKVSPQDPKVLYACVSVASHGETGALLRSTDIGETWARIDHSVDPKGTMMTVTPHPEDANVVHAATRAGQVFATLDGGKTWSTHQLPEGCAGVYSLACG